MRNLLVIVFLSAGSFAHGQQCDWEELKKECSKSLKPFQYYAFKTTRFGESTDEQKKELQIPIFHDSEYRLIFNTRELNGSCSVQIWNAPVNYPDRKKIFEAQSSEELIVYDPPATSVNNRIFIDYIVSSNDNSSGDSKGLGCIMLYSGFKH